MSQSISDKQKEIPSITISKLSNYCHFNCDKLLWNALNYKQKTEYSALTEAFQRRSKEMRKILQDAQIGKFLYRLKFEVPDDLYNKLEIKENVRIESFIPDFIEVIQEDGEKRLRIWDAKASKEARVSHQFQVATYSFLLDYIIKAKNMRGISISRSGGLFLSSPENLKRQTFRIDFLFPKVERLLKNDLSRIASSSKVSWHYNARCKTCEFVNDCRKDAKGTMAMIPYLSMENALFLKRLFRNGKLASDVDIEDLCINFSKLDINDNKGKVEEEGSDFKYLVDYVNSLTSDDKNETKNKRKIKQIIKYNEDLKISPYLDVHETENVQFIGTPTATFPQKTDHNLVITISLDPFDSYPFGWAICLYNSDGNITEHFQDAESISKSENETLLAFISLMETFVTSLIDIFQYLAEKKSRACIFVYSDQEKITIQDSLIKLITLNSDKVSKEIQDAATQCLFNLFEDCSVLLAVGNDNSESSELPNEWNEFPRLIVLEHSVRENIAINVPGFYQVIDIWEKMVKPTLKDQELIKNLESHIFNIDLENIYLKWDSGIVTEDTINQSHLYRSEFVNAVIQAYYTLLKKLTNDIAFKLLFYPQEFVLSKVKSFSNHYLGKLYFFKQFEAITTCSRIKEDRLNDFIQGEAINGIRVKLEKFVEKENKETNEWTALFEVLNNDSKFFVLESKTFKEYILVDDTMEGTLDAIRFPDLKCKDKFWGYPLTVLALIDVENNSIFKIKLKGIFKKRMNIGATYRLYKRYIDFNSDKILNTLIEIDKQSNSLFLNLLKDPNEWGTSSLPNYLKELNTTAFKLRDSFGMSPSQRDISVSLLKKRLQIIWGPPGSGKTHFLALFVLRYLNIVNPQPAENNNNFIIGITAFTRTAIDNLLERIARIKDKNQSDFLLVRMVNEPTKNTLDGVKDYKAKILSKKIAGSSIPEKHIIIGGTVWDWYKFRKEWGNWTGCDIMIIDEGSQLLTSDACVVVESLNPDHGRLIIAGDHMQLGPIIQNKYPDFSENHPLILGSIQQCLMRKEDGSIFNEGDFFIKKGEKRDFGPCTLMLKDNWRMNDGLNNFFQKIYGDDYISRNPSLALNFEDDKLSHIEPAIRKILLPGSGITLVKLSLKNHEELESLSEKILRGEADVVAKIVSAYFDASRKTNQDSDKPSLFIVTPHHRQRCAITSRVTEYLSNPEFSLNINTVEKMQGQEADLVIACFGFLDVDEIARESNFLFDRNRWNVAISRARCKIILLTTEEVLYPKGMGIFTNKKTSEGWIYISMIESWVQQQRKGIIEWVIDEASVI
ncbi:P-loop containing nucleoside triphosphate hydrolase protein [Gigaspora margarita]|uniref:P-loop containing nucleoside triphosphate hydrolase protein n=1 Tax=Gigaspora margarita TaxID=4874 RepID=A0A8H3XCR0_GIGMA|nr:P-loop containing nucleoside triphosphate hydrolase protein [Gigaspora margarita]